MKKIKLQIWHPEGDKAGLMIVDDTPKNRKRIQIRINAIKSGQTFDVYDLSKSKNNSIKNEFLKGTAIK